MAYTVLQPVAVFAAEAIALADDYIRNGTVPETEKQSFDCIFSSRRRTRHMTGPSPTRLAGAQGPRAPRGQRGSGWSFEDALPARTSILTRETTKGTTLSHVRTNPADFRRRRGLPDRISSRRTAVSCVRCSRGESPEPPTHEGQVHLCGRGTARSLPAFAARGAGLLRTSAAMGNVFASQCQQSTPSPSLSRRPLACC